MFRTGFLSVISSLVLYTQQKVYVIQDPASKQLWWTENQSETCRVLFQK